MGQAVCSASFFKKNTKSESSDTKSNCRCLAALQLCEKLKIYETVKENISNSHNCQFITAHYSLFCTHLANRLMGSTISRGAFDEHLAK
jgi:hypothetical protein